LEKVGEIEMVFNGGAFSARDMFLMDGFLVVITTRILAVYDITAPDNPSLVGRYGDFTCHYSSRHNDFVYVGNS
jgi:histone acetyltransferase (RNA polymerase elongator complex component)